MNKVLTWLVRYPLACLASILVAVVGMLLLLVGIKANPGGIIGDLFGRKRGSPNTTTLSKDRVGEDGAPIPVGTPDELGWTQVAHQDLKVSKNPLRDRSKIAIQTNSGKAEVVLPTGVQDKDVQAVYQVTGETYAVEVKSSSKVKASDLLKTLPKP